MGAVFPDRRRGPAVFPHIAEDPYGYSLHSAGTRGSSGLVYDLLPDAIPSYSASAISAVRCVFVSGFVLHRIHHLLHLGISRLRSSGSALTAKLEQDRMSGPHGSDIILTVQHLPILSSSEEAMEF